MKKKPKRLNPYSKRNRVITRVSNDELQKILEKAHVYAHGNISEFLRIAALGYKRGK